MKSLFCFLPLTAILCLVSSGCSQRNNVKAEVSKLNEAFPTANVATPATPENPADSASVKQADPNALVNRAVTALQNNDQVGAVTLLNTAQDQTGLTAKQRMAVHETVTQVYADLVSRAAKGDQKAQAALNQLEKTYSQ